MRLNGISSSPALAIAIVSPLLLIAGCIHDTGGVAQDLRAEPPFKSYQIAAPLTATRDAVIDAAKASSSGQANFAEVAAVTDNRVVFDMVQVWGGTKGKWGVMTVDLSPADSGTRCDFRITTINLNGLLKGQLEMWPDMVWAKVRLKLS